jgi:DNA-binding NtrC family response regulator
MIIGIISNFQAKIKINMRVTLKILIIDDDKVDMVTILRSISHSGIIADVESVFSARDGIEKVKAVNYDLIFLDYMMPDSDGISFLKKLRDLDIETPVIFVTSQGDEKIASQAILGGASDYIPKTLLTPDGVSQSIRNALKLNESLKERKKNRPKTVTRTRFTIPLKFKFKTWQLLELS